MLSDKVAPPARVDVIDAFRGIAILSVIVHHYFFARWHDVGGYTHDYPTFLETGKAGIYLFFVISGLVISMTVLNTHSSIDFAVKRLARLFPALLVCCSITFVVENTLGPAELHTSFADYLMSLILLSHKTGYKLVDSVYWTLLIEVEFYALMALGYRLLKEHFWIAAIVGAFIRYKYMVFFLIGMWMYFYIFDRKSPAAKWLLPFCIVYLGLYLQQHPFPLEAAYIVITLTGLFVSLSFFPNIKCEPLAFVGRISYPLYLLHQYLGVIIIRYAKQLHMSDLGAVFIAVVACASLAVVIHYTVEVPAKDILLSLWRKKRDLRSSFP